MKARIHNDVRPYGGRVVEVASLFTYPNGRKVVRVHAPAHGRSGRGGWFADIREYNEGEVTLLDEPVQSVAPEAI